MPNNKFYSFKYHIKLVAGITVFTVLPHHEINFFSFARNSSSCNSYYDSVGLFFNFNFILCAPYSVSSVGRSIGRLLAQCKGQSEFSVCYSFTLCSFNLVKCVNVLLVLVRSGFGWQQTDSDAKIDMHSRSWMGWNNMMGTGAMCFWKARKFLIKCSRFVN